jgi:hypothetical protein
LRNLQAGLELAGVPERIDLPVLACVRNPWDWYVSLYFFMETRYRAGHGAFGVPRAEWAPGAIAWARAYARGLSAQGFREALPIMLEELHDKADYDVIPPQALFLRGEDGRLGVRPIQFDGLRANIIAAIEEVTGSALPRGLRQQLERHPKTNTSKHDHYSRYYTPELVALVARYESWLIETLGYTFEQH